MTGTATTEADEFQDIYNLEVLEVPTNMPLVRIDDDDEVYRTTKEKYRSIISLIEDCKLRGQPVLVGTTSIEKSEQLADMLREAGWEAHLDQAARQGRAIGAPLEIAAFVTDRADAELRALAGRLTLEARALVERDYHWTGIADRLLRVYDELLAV